MGNIADNFKQIHERIKGAAENGRRRTNNIRLVAVSKRKPVSMVKEAYDAEQRIFGENYVQEMVSKADELSDLDIEWHFIGHLQTNKVKYIVPFVDCIHSIDSIRLAEEVDKRLDRKIECFIEVNLAGEASKTGVSRDDLFELVKAIDGMPNLKLLGLMTMPPFDEDPEKSRPYFKGLRNLLVEINNSGISENKLTELSMGMTEDLEIAIEEGSTMVRVGTAIFGER